MTGPRVKAALSAALLFLLFALSPLSAAETKINARSIEHRDSVYTARGAVSIERDGERLEADSATYDEATGKAEAEGGVKYETPGIEIKAAKAALDLNTKTGVLYDGEVFIKEGNYRIRGAEIYKTGEDRYFLKRASVTTCDGPVPAWCIKGHDVDVIVGDRLKARDVTFSVKGFPVLYTPYLRAPVHTERKTGLLLPTFGFRKSKGAYYRQSFFWAISENRDATLYLDAYSRRGVGTGAEYRYIEREGVEGQAYAYHLRDNELGEDFNYFKAWHRQETEPVSGYLDLNIVNNREYFRLYEPYLRQSSKRFLESRAEIYGRWGNSRLYLLNQYSYDLLKGVDESSIPQRLPEAGYFEAPSRLGPFVLSGLATASNFTRDEGPAGQRYDAGVTLAHSLGAGPVFSQTLGARETYYDLGGDDSINNVGFRYDAVLWSRLSRQYRALRHAIEASLAYRFFSMSGETPPLFDVLELEEEETSKVELTLMNRFFDHRGEFLAVRLSEAYDAKKGDRPFMPLNLELSLRRPVLFRTSITYDVQEGFISSADTEVSFALSRATVQARHNYRKGEELMLYALEASYRVGRFLSLNGGVQYDSEAGGLRELLGGFLYDGQCWALKLDYVKRPNDYSILMSITLKGLSSLGGHRPPLTS